VGSNRIVVVAPLLDDDQCLLQAVEDFSVQQFIAQLVVEGFAVPILPGAVGFDVKGFGSDLGQPLAHDLGGHLWAVVGSDVFWDTARQHDIGHRLDDAEAVDPASNTDRQAFARELIDQGQQPNLHRGRYA